MRGSVQIGVILIHKNDDHSDKNCWLLEPDIDGWKRNVI